VSFPKEVISKRLVEFLDLLVQVIPLYKSLTVKWLYLMRDPPNSFWSSTALYSHLYGPTEPCRLPLRNPEKENLSDTSKAENPGDTGLGIRIAKSWSMSLRSERIMHTCVLINPFGQQKRTLQKCTLR